MQHIINIARKTAKNRVGPDSWSFSTYERFSRITNKNFSTYTTWFAYDANELTPYLESNGWRIKGFNKIDPTLYCDFIPIDYDSDNINNAFNDVVKTCNYLDSLGLRLHDHYSVWLSGSKGFHIEISIKCFDVNNPSTTLLRDCRAFGRWLATTLEINIDQSLYQGARMYRCAGSRHDKTGLHKIKLREISLDYLAQRHIWAAKFDEKYNEFCDEKPVIHIPEFTAEIRETRKLDVIDTTLSIIQKCHQIQNIMVNPEGREKRRQIAGILLETFGESSDTLALYDAWSNHPYMDSRRMADANKWIDEFNRDGVIKCHKTCSSLGCTSEQKMICGTKYPTDHIIDVANITTVPIDEARSGFKNRLKDIINDLQSNDINVFDMPIGSGKTTTAIELIAELKPRVLYLCPTHQLADEINSLAHTYDIKTTLQLRSRRYLFAGKKAPYNGFCPSITQIDYAQLNGVSIQRDICAKCPMKPECPYYDQFKNIETYQLVIGMHAHCNEYMYDLLNVASMDIVIIDESPILSFSTEIRALDEKIANYYINNAFSVREKLLYDPENNDTTEITSFSDIMKATIEQEKSILNDKTSHLTNRLVLELITSLAAGHPITYDQAVFLRDNKYYHLMKQFNETLIDELNIVTPGLDYSDRYLFLPNIAGYAIEAHLAGNREYTINNTVYFPKKFPDKKIIIFDATCNKVVYDHFFKVCAMEHQNVYYNNSPSITQTHARIVQLTNSGYNKTRLSENENVFHSLKYLIHSMKQSRPDIKILCVTSKSIEKEIYDINPDTHHYGELRGLNEYSDYDVQFIVGGYFISNVAILEILQRLGVYDIDLDTLDNNPMIFRKKHRALDGTSYFSERKLFNPFNDSMRLANAISVQLSASEITQAIRLRLYSGKTDKEVYIFTNIGLDNVYADSFRDLENLTSFFDRENDSQNEINDAKDTKELMMIKFNRLDKEFTYSDISSNEQTARRFIKALEDNGLITKIKPKIFRKNEKPNLKPAKQDKITIHSILDDWFSDKNQGYEFSISDISSVTGCNSSYILLGWIDKMISSKLLIKIGSGRATKYRKYRAVMRDVFDVH